VSDAHDIQHTERLPGVDVAAAGGWTDTGVHQTVYQQADKGTMFEVVTGGKELREA
jgi:hypothetical protein